MLPWQTGIMWVTAVPPTHHPTTSTIGVKSHSVLALIIPHSLETSLVSLWAFHRPLSTTLLLTQPIKVAFNTFDHLEAK